MSSVVFNYDNFIELYHQFSEIPERRLYQFFVQAEAFCDNTASSPITDLKKREVMLYLLTCHLATLSMRGDQVGVLASASEGSVSASYTVPSSANAAYFAQTQCGYTFWQMSLPYRTCRYFTGRRR